MSQNHCPQGKTEQKIGKKTAAHYDVIIIGAGPVGLSLACSLSTTNLQIAIVEKNARSVLEEPPVDGRDVALTHFSEDILKELAIWPHVPADEISTIKEAKVLNGTSPYALNFDHHDTDKDYLGRLIPNYLIRKAAYRAVADCKNVTIITETEVQDIKTDTLGAHACLSDGRMLSSSLIAAADSRFSPARRKMGIPTEMKDFGRVVIVCEMTHEKPHHHIAYECFHYDQTLAVLPLNGNKSSIVITLPADKADDVVTMDINKFNADISTRFDHRLGKMELAGKRFPYPLMAVYADRFIDKRFALLGDAAVGMHPVTAHGFNLGLKGQHILSCEIKRALATGTDIGSLAVLKPFQEKHRHATRPLYLGTNALVNLYTKETLPAKLARRALLHLGNSLRPAKRLIVEQLTETKAP